MSNFTNFPSWSWMLNLGSSNPLPKEVPNFDQLSPTNTKQKKEPWPTSYQEGDVTIPGHDKTLIEYFDDIKMKEKTKIIREKKYDNMLVIVPLSNGAFQTVFSDKPECGQQNERF